MLVERYRVQRHAGFGLGTAVAIVGDYMRAGEQAQSILASNDGVLPICRTLSLQILYRTMQFARNLLQLHEVIR